MKKKLSFPTLPIIFVGLLVIATSIFIFWRVEDDTPNHLIGSWHKEPSVAAGFNERYVFLKDGRYIYYPNENIENGMTKQEGTWKVKGDTLTLYPQTGSNLSNVSMEIGKLEDEKDKDIPYKKKVQILGQYFWKYSEEVDIWKE